ncbi:MAG TPA: hypothetical protein VG326_20205 [Tepidisphaeraceae bacterium]|nr:hypothetical protein [Tepidisphaeraceae bacterium]
MADFAAAHFNLDANAVTSVGISGKEWFIADGAVEYLLQSQAGGTIAVSQILAGPPQPGTYTVTANSVSGGGAPIIYANIDALTVAAQSGDTNFVLDGNKVPVILQGSSGNDTFTVNGDGAPVTLNGSPAPDLSTATNANSLSQFFTVANTDSTLITDLNHGIIDSTLLAFFMGNSHTIVTNNTMTNAIATLSLLSSGPQWLITDGSTTYTLTENPDPANGLFDSQSTISVVANGTDGMGHPTTNLLFVINAADTQAVVSSLNASTLNATIKGDFSTNHTTLSGSASVVPTAPSRQWTLTDANGVVYTLTQNNDGSIAVTNAAHTALFTIVVNPTTSIVSSLNGHSANALLSAFFAINGFTLTAPVVTGSGPWTITDGTTVYQVSSIASGLSIQGTTIPKNLLFTINPTDAAAEIADLNNNVVDATLLKDFQSASSTLSSSNLPDIVIVNGQQWEIIDGTNLYLLTLQSSDGSILVTRSTKPVGGNDTFILNANVAGLTINGYFGNDTIIVNSNTGNATVNGGAGTDIYTVNANTGTLTLNGFGGAGNVNTFNILANVGTLNVNTNGGPSTFNVANITLPINLNSGNGLATYIIQVPLLAAVNIVGGTTIQSLIIDGTPGADHFVISATSITGVGATINYSGLMSLTINAEGGNDTFLVTGNSAATTTINGGTGSDTFNIESVTYTLIINVGGSAPNVINLGNPQNSSGDTIQGLQGAITIAGNGNTILNINDAADGVSRTGYLNNAVIEGLGMGVGGITYSGLDGINLLLGPGTNHFTVQSTPAGMPVTIGTGNGSDVLNIESDQSLVTVNSGAGVTTVNIGSMAPASGGVLTGIVGGVTINGDGHDQVAVDDSGDTAATTATLTPASLTGLGLAPAGVLFGNIASFSLQLGIGGTDLTITGTAAKTVTTLFGNLGPIAGGDTINVQANAGALTILTSSGTNTVNVGSLAPATGGTVNGIQGVLSITGRGVDTVNVDDTGSTATVTGVLTDTQLTLTGMGLPGLFYASLTNLNINLGSGMIGFTINNTSANTSLTTGSGNDTVTILATAPLLTSVSTGAGNDVVNVRSESGTTNINVGTGTNVVNVGSNAPSLVGGTLAGIVGNLTLTGGGANTVNIDDTGDTAAQSAPILTAKTLTGLSAGTIDFSGFTGLTALNISLGSGGNTLLINDTPAKTTTTVNTGAGADHVTIASDSGPLNLNTQAGNDVINVQGTNATTVVNTGAGVDSVTVASAAPATLSAIQGALTITGNGADALLLDDSGSTIARTGQLTPTTLTGFAMGSMGVTFSGIATLTLTLGSGGTQLTVTNTAVNTATTINTTTGADTVTLKADAGPTTIHNAGGKETVFIQTTNAVTNIVTDTGTATTAATIGNGGLVSGILGAVTETGHGLDSLTIDDSNDLTSRTVTLGGATVTGLAPTTVTYSGLANLTVNLGAGADTLTIATTPAGATTNVNAGAGNDSITVDTDAGPTNINAGAGANTIAVRAAADPLTITSALNSTDTITIGYLGSVAAIAGTVDVIGNGADIVTVDDSADTTAKTSAVLTTTAITGLAAGEIDYSGVATLNLNFGSGSDNLVVQGTGAANTNINTGNGNDIVTVQADSGTTHINTGTGQNQVYLQTTGGPTVVNTANGGKTAVTIGNAGSAAGINGPVTVNGSGSDTLTIDDSADTLFQPAVSVTNSSVTGISPAAIAYNALASLTLNLGPAGDGVTVVSTATNTTTTINSGAGNDGITVQSTGGPTILNLGTGSTSVRIASKTPANLAGIQGAITVNGNPNTPNTSHDSLTIDDSGVTTPVAGVLTATTVTGLSPATITYNNLQVLTITLGKGGNTFNVKSTALGTTTLLGMGGGTNTITVGSNAPALNGVLTNINGTLVITGSGADTLTLDDGADAVGQTGSLSATSLVGIAPANISYTGIAKLALNLGAGNDNLTIFSTIAGTTTVNTGAGNDTVNLQATTGPTTINTGVGADNILIGSVAPGIGGTLDKIRGPLTIVGGSNTVLTLDDTGSATTRTVTISANTIVGLAPVTITYGGVSTLNVNLGSGGDSVSVVSDSAALGTFITGGLGKETFSVKASATTGLAAQLPDPLTFDGGAGGADTLSVDDTLDKTARTVGLSASAITGLGGPINYKNLSTLSLKLGAGSDTVNITGINPGTATTVDGGAGTNSAAVNIAGDFNGSLTLAETASATVAVSGNFNGMLTTNGNITTMTVGGNLAGALSVGGTLTSLTIGANDTGTISAAAVGTIAESNAAAGVGGVVLSVIQKGILRQIIVTDTNGNSLAGAVFKVLYDGATISDPQAAISVTNTGMLRFDLLLTSPVGYNFDLSRFMSAGGALANARNITIEGNILGTISSKQASYFGLATSTVGGVYLPADHVAAVSTWGSIAAGTIRVTSIEGLAFATLIKGSTTYKATSLSSESSESTLLLALANTGASKLAYYEAVVLPTETLRVIYSSKNAVVLFVDGTEGADDGKGANPTTNNGDFEEHGMILTDVATGAQANNPITALTTFSSNSAANTTYITQLSLIGDGAAVDSSIAIANIVSTGVLGNLYLRGNGTSSVSKVSLNSIMAPAISGSIDLFGGTLTGTIETTGVRIDPITGATSAVNADLGSTTLSGSTVNGVTTLHVTMGVGSRIVSRGNLISKITLDTALLGTIAAQGNIGVGVVSSGKLTRFGGIVVGSGTSTGDIIALGNIFGDISVAGSFAGRIAAKGATISGLASTRLGILGNLTLTGGIATTGAVVSGGLIGDSAGSTKLTVTASKVTGFVASKGALTASATLPTGHVFQNAAGANATALNNIWTTGGAAITALDLTPGDLTGLSLVLVDANGLKIVSGALTGTNA